MSLTTATPTDQFAKEITKTLTGVAPAAVPVDVLLAPHRKFLTELRAKGYTNEQLAAALKQSAYQLDIKPMVLGRVINGLPSKPRRRPIKYKINIPLKVVPPASAMVQ